ncbi:MAG: UDP-glucose 4-epimerase GalE [Alysiella sp.]|uniref:UDP-glucose 4-epimerase GalE n=1 Tax=Alysiella sp. TaxID=1872483 RepID=UPI0026DDA335|nr:UDP-glucose 4-epimerase GalE [Alysiella sp.]MDO4433066.1 UDP-glucose 4-epimerase GalE [Alysiella sp.]
MNILVTGGTGFIGAHTVVELMSAGHYPIILDNLSNSSSQVLDRVACITGSRPVFYEGDIRDRALLQLIFRRHQIESVIHFAALKAVGESVQKPLVYYNNNVSGSLILLEEMQNAGIKSIVFSSSATVYGDPQTVPIAETAPTGATTNPYGMSKHIMERMMLDLQAADREWSVIVLRYFNPIGAHESGLIGEQPNGIPNNLLPYVCQVAAGKLPELSVFGSDYATHDGTGVRDYIHVVDLALGHLKALNAKAKQSGVHIYNLGTGKGYSVLDIVRAFEAASGQKVPYVLKPRRAGDIAICYANPHKAAVELGWAAQHDLARMMVDSWRWQSNNPNGYA